MSKNRLTGDGFDRYSSECGQKIRKSEEIWQWKIVLESICGITRFIPH